MGKNNSSYWIKWWDFVCLNIYDTSNEILNIYNKLNNIGETSRTFADVTEGSPLEIIGAIGGLIGSIIQAISNDALGNLVQTGSSATFHLLFGCIYVGYSYGYHGWWI